MTKVRKTVREREKEAFEEGFRIGLEEARREAQAEGQKSLLLDTLERRLKRPLTEEETTAFHGHFEVLGSKAFVRHYIDLDAPALAAWLAQAPEASRP